MSKTPSILNLLSKMSQFISFSRVKLENLIFLLVSNIWQIPCLCLCLCLCTQHLSHGGRARVSKLVPRIFNHLLLSKMFQLQRKNNFNLSSLYWSGPRFYHYILVCKVGNNKLLCNWLVLSIWIWRQLVKAVKVTDENSAKVIQLFHNLQKLSNLSVAKLSSSEPCYLWFHSIWDYKIDI